MPTSPQYLPPPQSQRPCANATVWQPLPEPQRRQGHELLTQLLTQVMHGEASQERSHEHQD
jgi:hypothetical protein